MGGLRFACFELAGLFGGLIGLGFWLLYSGVSFAGVLDLICLWIVRSGFGLWGFVSCMLRGLRQPPW